MNIAVGVPAIDRPGLTVADTVTNVRRGGFNGFLLLACEPGTNIPAGLKNVEVVQHAKKLGHIDNADFVYSWLLKNTAADYIMAVENDTRFCQTARPCLEKLCENEEPFSYASLFTPACCELSLDKIGWRDYRPGEANCTAQALFFRRSSLQMMRSFPEWTAWDGTIGKIGKNMGLPCWYHVPSLSEHISDFSIRTGEMRTDFKAKGYKDNIYKFKLG